MLIFNDNENDSLQVNAPSLILLVNVTLLLNTFFLLPVLLSPC